MLTDPADFHTLTMNGLPRSKQVFFCNFVKNRGFPLLVNDTENNTGSVSGSGSGSGNDRNSNGSNNGTGDNGTSSIEEGVSNLSMSMQTKPSSSSTSSPIEEIAKTMHRAYHDMILKEMQKENIKQEHQQHQQQQQNTTHTYNYKPLQNIILEVQTMIRNLIPNRKDLHHLLKDEDVTNCHLDSFAKVSKRLMLIGSALSMLESEYRSLTTKQWMDVCAACSTTCSSNLLLDQGENNQSLHVYGPIHGNQEEGGNSTITSTGKSTSTSTNYNFSMSCTSFALASISFLHYKAELCQAETADFQLGHLLAPRIYKLGRKYLSHLFQEKFGSSTNTNTNSNTNTSTSSSTRNEMESYNVPNTKAWIEEMVQNTSYTMEEVLSSEEKRGHVLLQTGWIDNILFRSPRSVNEEDENHSSSPTASPTASPSSSSSPKPSSPTHFLMPEVLWLDMTTIRDIRMTTKISVVGSVLALHATSAAGVNDSILKKDPLDFIVEDCRVKLAVAMGNRNVGSQELYERNIGHAVVELAKALNPSISNDSEKSLLNRTKATLRGEDPVIKLLDNRMRGIFRMLVVSNPQTRQQVPTSIKTGRNLSFSKSGGGVGVGVRGGEHLSSANGDMTFNFLFKQAAKQEFISKGFGFYSNELAEASLLACRTINLVLYLYGSQLLEKIFFNVCRHRHQSDLNES
jgi:hypothetical protein